MSLFPNRLYISPECCISTMFVSFPSLHFVQCLTHIRPSINGSSLFFSGNALFSFRRMVFKLKKEDHIVIKRRLDKKIASVLILKEPTSMITERTTV